MKNKYLYKCPYCGQEVSSLTKHYKKEHPEHTSEALKHGTQQRIAAGQSNPAQNFRKSSTPENNKDKATQTEEVKQPPTSEGTGTEAELSSPEMKKSTSFLDSLDDF